MAWRDKAKPSHLPKYTDYTVAVLAENLKTSPCFANTTGQKLVLSAVIYTKGKSKYCHLSSCWGISTARVGGGGYEMRTAALRDALKNLGIEINFEGRSLDSAAIFLAEEIARIFQTKTSVLVL